VPPSITSFAAHPLTTFAPLPVPQICERPLETGVVPERRDGGLVLGRESGVAVVVEGKHRERQHFPLLEARQFEAVRQAHGGDACAARTQALAQQP